MKPLGEEKALPPPEKDMPKVLAAEVMDVEEDILPEMAETTEERLLIIEERLNKLRQEMNLLRPAVAELIARKNLTEDMVKEAEVTKIQETKAPTAPALQTVKPKVQEVKPPVKKAAYKGEAKLMDIRTGEHAGKTRLVMDIGSKASFSYDLDNSEKVLIIELPDVQHDKVLKASLSKSPYISSYLSEATDNGSRVIVQLKQPAKVLAAETLGAISTRSARIYLDIGS